MAFRDNSTLITSANKINLIADGGVANVYTGTDKAEAFIIADGAVGDDTINGFSHNDTIITGKMIFDGNRDGYIDFMNAILDVDRTGSGSKNAGEDNISVFGTVNDRVTTIRYLGNKDGGFVYADAGTRDALFGHFTNGFVSANGGGDKSITQQLKIDNDVGDNGWDLSQASVAILTDNALGLNFGSDVIDGFGKDDLLIFTAKLYDADSGGKVTFGKNLVLDLSGADGGQPSDPTTGPGGQIDFLATKATSGIYYLGEKTIDGTDYYYYGKMGAATPMGVHIVDTIV